MSSNLHTYIMTATAEKISNMRVEPFHISTLSMVYTDQELYADPISSVFATGQSVRPEGRTRTDYES